MSRGASNGIANAVYGTLVGGALGGPGGAIAGGLSAGTIGTASGTVGGAIGGSGYGATTYYVRKKLDKLRGRKKYSYDYSTSMLNSTIEFRRGRGKDKKKRKRRSKNGMSLRKKAAIAAGIGATGLAARAALKRKGLSKVSASPIERVEAAPVAPVSKRSRPVSRTSGKSKLEKSKIVRQRQAAIQRELDLETRRAPKEDFELDFGDKRRDSTVNVTKRRKKNSFFGKNRKEKSEALDIRLAASSARGKYGNKYSRKINPLTF